MSDQTKPMLPGLPEPDGWIGANDLDPEAGIEGLTFASVRAIQLATWKAAMEHAAGLCDFHGGPITTAVAESCAAAIRQAPEPGEGG